MTVVGEQEGVIQAVPEVGQRENAAARTGTWLAAGEGRGVLACLPWDRVVRRVTSSPHGSSAASEVMRKPLCGAKGASTLSQRGRCVSRQDPTTTQFFGPNQARVLPSNVKELVDVLLTSTSPPPRR